jgi:hypothetical protein
MENIFTCTELENQDLYTFLTEGQAMKNVNNYIMCDQVQNQVTAIMASDNVHKMRQLEKFTLVFSICSIGIVFLLF